MSRLVEARVAAWIVAALAVWSAGCGDHKIVAGPDEQKPGVTAFLAIVSNAVGVAAAAGSGQVAAAEAEVAYISLPPGSIPGGEVATIANRRTGATVATPVTEGGFDPVSVLARTGDTLQVEVRVAGNAATVSAVFGVPPRRRPIVVRTDPPPRKRDVPLNASLVIVFSEPVDPATLSTSSVQLLRNGTAVAGTVAPVSGSPWIAAFTPTSPLDPETEYQIVVTQDVRDLGGETLEAAVLATFTTGTEIEGRIAFVSSRDGAGWPAGNTIPYIYVANPDGSGVRRLTQGMLPSWAPDGRSLIFHTWSNNRFGGITGSDLPEIRVIHADGTDLRTLGLGWSPAWSPDGTKIVFSSDQAGGGIFVMNPDGFGVTRLLHRGFASGGAEDAGTSWPSWSPDGRSIAFVRTSFDEPWQIYIMDADGSQPRPLNMQFSVGDARPAWSPDGSTLLFQVRQQVSQLFLWEIASVNVDGSSFRSHTQATYVGDPDWSPDGSSIAFSKFSAPGDASSPPGTRVRIYVLSTQGGPIRQLIPEAVAPVLPSYWDSNVAWSRVKQ